MDEELAMAAAVSSECSSGCQSGWTTYLDDHSSYSNSYTYGTGRFHGKARRQPYYCDDYSEEDDLSMISDASSGPRQQSSTGNDVEAGGAAAVAHANAERRGRREAAAVARRQSKRAANASQLEDTASSPAFYGYAKAMGSGVANGYGAQMMEIGNAADFSYAFSTTTGFKSPLNGTALGGGGGGYMQMQYCPAAVKPMPARQEYRDAPENKRW